MSFNAHFGLTEQNMIAHSEWSRRKTDPYYDSSRRIIDQIREDTANAMGLSADDLEAIRGIIRDELGGSRILMPKVTDGESDRYGNQGVVNAVWHATSGDRKLFTVLTEVPKDTADEIAERLED